MRLLAAKLAATVAAGAALAMATVPLALVVIKPGVFSDAKVQPAAVRPKSNCRVVPVEIITVLLIGTGAPLSQLPSQVLLLPAEMCCAQLLPMATFILLPAPDAPVNVLNPMQVLSLPSPFVKADTPMPVFCEPVCKLCRAK